ncbi:MAG: CoA transferase subunit A [Acidimicrobiia bacterium]|nr:CoA transferase subunit A [Acidimicrobiia bacterium]
MTGLVSKQISLAEAAASVPDGATVALGGLSMNSAPMAFVRELVRADKRDLTLVTIVAGMCVDWLAAAGCASRVVAGLVSLEGFGLAPHFRHAAQSGKVKMEEYSEHLLICRLQAQARRLPFMPTVAGLGTDVPALHTASGALRVETDAVTGRPYVACTPLAVDVAVVHTHEADVAGNARVNPKLIWMDSEIVNAADRTIVTTERIAEGASFSAEPHRTTYPRFMVDAVCEAPRGAFPTSCFPDYGHHSGFFEDYLAACGSPADFADFFERRVVGPATWADFLAANGVQPAGGDGGEISS